MRALVAILCLPVVVFAGDGLVYSRTLPVLTQGNLASGIVRALAVDAAGNTYVAGSTENAAFPVTAGAFQTTIGKGTCTAPTYNPLLPPTKYPCDDAFLAKLDPEGNIVAASFLGGDGLDGATAVAVDQAGYIYVAGNTAGAALDAVNNFPVTAGSPFTPGKSGVFLAKLDPSATRLIYSFVIPEAAGKVAIAADAQGNAYLTATTTNFPTTPGALHTRGAILAVKLSPDGARLLYAAQFGGSTHPYGAEAPADIAVDSTGSAYIVGSTDSQDFPVTDGAFQTARKSTSPTAFAVKLDPAGAALVYATYLGGSAVDAASLVRVDGSGNAHVFGFTQSTDFPVTAGAFHSAPGNIANTGFLAKLRADGSGLIYSTYVAGAFGFSAATNPMFSYGGFDLDASGNAILAGGASAGFPTTTGAYQPCLAGGRQDAFLARLDPQGVLFEATYFGGSGSDLATLVAAAPDGTVVFGGTTDSSDLPLTEARRTAAVHFLVRLRPADPTRPDGPCMALAIENAASKIEGPVAPGELITIRGLHLGPESGTVDPAELSAVQVYFDDTPVPLLYAQSRQINAQVPFELAGRSSAQVHVVYRGVSTRIVPIAIAPSAPGLFYNGEDSTQGVIINEDGTLNTPANPAKAGSVVAVWGTGGGVTSPALTTGAVAGGEAPLVLPAKIQIDLASPLEILYAGAIPGVHSGVFAVRFRLPEFAIPNVPHEVDITVGNASSVPFSTARISIQ